MRWWDGASWTEHVQAAGPPKGEPLGSADTSASRPWYTMKRWWVLGVVLLFVVVGAISGGESTNEPAVTASEPTVTAEPQPSEEPTKEPAKEPKPEPKEKPEPEPEPAKPKVVKVQARQMLDEFEGNEAAADAKYKGKVVEVTGHVDKVDTDFWDDEQYVVQLSDGSEWVLWTVNCNDVFAEQAAKVQPKSLVTVRGTFDDGGDLGVEIKDCEVL